MKRRSLLPMRFTACLIVIMLGASSNAQAGIPFHPVTKTMVCAALLETLRQEGHTVEEVSRFHTSATVEQLREFRRFVLHEDEPESSFDAIDGSSSQAFRFPRIASRLAGFEIQSAERGSDLAVWGHTISGREKIESLFNRVEMYSRAFRDRYQIPWLGASAVALHHGYDLFDRLALDTLDGRIDPLVAAFVVALIWPFAALDHFPQMVSQSDWLGAFRFFKEGRRLLSSGATNQWVFHSRNDQITRLGTQTPTSTVSILFSEFQQSIWLVGRSAFQVILKIASNVDKGAVNFPLTEVLSDMLLYVDSDQVPHLMMGARFNRVGGPVVPRAPKRRKVEQRELLPSF